MSTEATETAEAPTLRPEHVAASYRPLATDANARRQPERHQCQLLGADCGRCWGQVAEVPMAGVVVDTTEDPRVFACQGHMGRAVWEFDDDLDHSAMGDGPPIYMAEPNGGEPASSCIFCEDARYERDQWAKGFDRLRQRVFNSNTWQESQQGSAMRELVGARQCLDEANAELARLRVLAATLAADVKRHPDPRVRDKAAAVLAAMPPENEPEPEPSEVAA